MEPAPAEGSYVPSPPDPDAAGELLQNTIQAQLRAAGRGDESAFAALYDSVAPRIYGLVLGILGDAHQSEQVAEEVFLQIWKTSSRFDPTRGSALSWIMTIAHRRAVDRVRATAAQRRRDVNGTVRSLNTPSDQIAEPAHATIEAATRIRGTLAVLPPTQRQAVELAYFGGHTHHEVAQLLQIPLGTARTRIRDGLTRLRDHLTPITTESA